MNNKSPILKGRRVVLRLPIHEDIASIISFYQQNAPHLNKYSPSVKEGFFNTDFWQKRIIESHNHFVSDKGCHFFIFQKGTKKILGYVNFFNFIRGALQGCILGYGLAEDAQGQGLMTEALELSVNYVVQELNLHRIEANYHPNNDRSAKILKKLGFIIEGTVDCYLRVNGSWEPHVRASLTNHNWKENKFQN